MTDAEMQEKLEVELTVLSMEHEVVVAASAHMRKAFALVAPNCIMMAMDFVVMPELQESCLN